MKPREYINTDSICLICVLVLILGIMALSIYSLNWVICSFSTIPADCTMNAISVLAVVGVFVLIVFFGLFFTLYKVDCKKEEYAIELKRLEILERYLDELAQKNKNSRRCGC